ncbi:hypothetical protein JZ751_024529 [Albula glossodonta]|uniref:Uncharacterized protein n=1 Tax=Albula glossodonta TaxID=121402 RepID=A0A8T2PEW0_9TELE|nr:hypothetical protein JZ751_024529 [Albula glossodonta]
MCTDFQTHLARLEDVTVEHDQCLYDACLVGIVHQSSSSGPFPTAPPSGPLACRLSLARPIRLWYSRKGMIGSGDALRVNCLGEVSAKQLQPALQLLVPTLDGQSLQALLMAGQEALSGERRTMGGQPQDSLCSKEATFPSFSSKSSLDDIVPVELVFNVSGVLLPRVVQLAALTQGLVVDRQGHCLHVHDLVIGYGGLRKWSQEKEDMRSYIISSKGEAFAIKRGCGAKQRDKSNITSYFHIRLLMCLTGRPMVSAEGLAVQRACSLLHPHALLPVLLQSQGVYGEEGHVRLWRQRGQKAHQINLGL